MVAGASVSMMLPSPDLRAELGWRGPACSCCAGAFPGQRRHGASSGARAPRKCRGPRGGEMERWAKPLVIDKPRRGRSSVRDLAQASRCSTPALDGFAGRPGRDPGAAPWSRAGIRRDPLRSSGGQAPGAGAEQHAESQQVRDSHDDGRQETASRRTGCSLMTG